MVLVSKYGLNRQMIYNLYAMLVDVFYHPTISSRAQPVPLQKMTALRFHVNGSFQKIIAHIPKISRQNAKNANRDMSNCSVEISKIT